MYEHYISCARCDLSACHLVRERESERKERKNQLFVAREGAQWRGKESEVAWMRKGYAAGLAGGIFIFQ